MNFLGHAFLTPDNDDLRLGNYIGEWIKGNPDKNLPSSVAAGVRVHREIDSFCDAHASTVKFREATPPSLRRFSGIMCDMYFGHRLAAEWASFNDESLPDFSERFMGFLHVRRSEMPAGARDFLTYMAAERLPVQMKSNSEMKINIERMSSRRPFLRGLGPGGAWLVENDIDLRSLFMPFIMDIKSRFGV